MSPMTLKEGLHVLTLAEQKKLSSEGQGFLIQTGLLADLFEAAGGDLGEVDRDEFRKMIGLDPLNFEITINHNQTLTEMVAAGNYDRVNKRITNQNFLHQGEGVVTLKPVLVHLDRLVRTDDVLTELKKRNLRPGNAAELLAFGSTYPEIQRKFPIVALGQSARVGGGPLVPCLYGRGSKRELGLGWYGRGWGGGCRFLAFEL